MYTSAKTDETWWPILQLIPARNSISPLFLQEIYHGSEIASIQVGNSTRRNPFHGGEKNLTRNEDMAIQLLVHIADDSEDVINAINRNHGQDTNLKLTEEQQLKSILESPIRYI